MSEMQCMLQMSPTRILMGGHRDKLIDFNLQICKETQVVSCAVCKIIKRIFISCLCGTLDRSE